MSEPTAQDVTTEPAGPTGLKAKLPMIAAIVVGLAVGGGTGAAVVGPMVASKLVPSPAKVDSAGHAEEAPAEGEHGAEGKDSATEAPPILPLENLVLNPASSGGNRYLLLSIAIESADQTSLKALTGRQEELKDLILSKLGDKTVDDLSNVTGREAIKVELIDAIKERFGKTSVKHLYFPQWVIQ